MSSDVVECLQAVFWKCEVDWKAERQLVTDANLSEEMKFSRDLVKRVE